MTLSSGFEHMVIDAASIVTDENAQVSGCIFDIYLDLARAGMAKCIRYGFAADAIGFIANRRMQRARKALSDHPEIDMPVSYKLPPNARERLFDIRRGTLWRSETANCVAAFFAHLAHELNDAF